jgi:hypothetical protein
MRHIRRNSVFAPSPAEMLKVLREKMEMWNDYVETSCNLSYWYDVLDKKIAEAEAKRTRGP